MAKEYGIWFIYQFIDDVKVIVGSTGSCLALGSQQLPVRKPATLSEPTITECS